MPTVNGELNTDLNSTEQTERDGLIVTRGEVPSSEVIMIDSAEVQYVEAAPKHEALVYVDTTAEAVTLEIGEVPQGTEVRIVNDADAGSASQIQLQAGKRVEIITAEAGKNVEAAPGAVATLHHVKNGKVVAEGALAA